MPGRLIVITCILLAAPLLLTDCQASQPLSDQLALVDTTWELQWLSHDGDEFVIAGDQAPPTATFARDELEPAQGTVTGFGGVNRYFGQYTTGPDGQMTIRQTGATRMAGPPEAMAIETAFLAVIGDAASFEQPDGETLVINDDESGSLRMILRVE